MGGGGNPPAIVFGRGFYRPAQKGPGGGPLETPRERGVFFPLFKPPKNPNVRFPLEPPLGKAPQYFVFPKKKSQKILNRVGPTSKRCAKCASFSLGGAPIFRSFPQGVFPSRLSPESGRRAPGAAATPTWVVAPSSPFYRRGFSPGPPGGNRHGAPTPPRPVPPTSHPPPPFFPPRPPRPVLAAPPPSHPPTNQNRFFW